MVTCSSPQRGCNANICFTDFYTTKKKHGFRDVIISWSLLMKRILAGFWSKISLLRMRKILWEAISVLLWKCVVMLMVQEEKRPQDQEDQRDNSLWPGTVETKQLNYFGMYTGNIQSQVLFRVSRTFWPNTPFSISSRMIDFLFPVFLVNKPTKA